MDHVPAQSWLKERGLGYYLDRDIIPTMYPCCLDCNVRLGAVDLSTIEERRKLLIHKLTAKAKKVNAGGEFSQEDYAELGPILKNMIKKIDHKHKELLRRIDALRNPDDSTD